MFPPCSSSTSTCSSAWLHSSQTGRLRPGERPLCHPALKASGLFPKPCPRSPAWCPPPGGREGGRKSRHKRRDDVFYQSRCSVFAMEMNGWLTAEWVQVKLTSSTWACVCWSLRLLVVLGGGGGAPLAPSAPGAPGAPGAPAGAESGADLQESWWAN